ncbi:hypothetical protein BBD42_14180 [Paenibacillus sp. BIHB 4019]|uniref:Magnesium transporter n=1 Tax=Paenibacillus sp. BIHB 4019 TaxID=1870819 RepID=A0A1B2DIH8_9BACL|nr:magnesium transporter CorA family protein [Paenibacillus sp. BIHB 4019]ANY67493.1 hypothetical protein BBD42_14180 [Paenibacillus sp. BIHB 4019]
MEIGQAGGKAMIHRVLRYPAQWDWQMLQLERQHAEIGQKLPKRKDNRKNNESFLAARPYPVHAGNVADSQKLEAKLLLPECASWLEECDGRTTNQITVAPATERGPLVHGTLMIQISDVHTDIQPFHFWVSGKRLVTMHEDMRLAIRFQADDVTSRLETCDTAPEALLVMLGVILGPFHEGLDGFENRLGDLENNMRSANRTGLMDVIIERRYDLLHWSHLFTPVRELHGSVKEAFLDGIMESEAYKRITHKLERIDTLLKHYSLEIDTLISMDDAISNFRGNDIMKTLTIFTVIFTPATVISALWGVNLQPLPWDKTWWGFTILCAFIIGITVLIYVWLWKKGWTGDMLIGRGSSGKLAATRSDRHSRKKYKETLAAEDSGRRLSSERPSSAETASQEQAPSAAKPLTRSRRL